jgi:hypothetical protein
METLDAVLVSWNLMEVWVVLADMHPDKPTQVVCSPSSRFKKLSLRQRVQRSVCFNPSRHQETDPLLAGRPAERVGTPRRQELLLFRSCMQFNGGCMPPVLSGDKQ